MGLLEMAENKSKRKALYIHGFPLGELTMFVNHLQVLGSSECWVFMR